MQKNKIEELQAICNSTVKKVAALWLIGMINGNVPAAAQSIRKPVDPVSNYLQLVVDCRPEAQVRQAYNALSPEEQDMVMEASSVLHLNNECGLSLAEGSLGCAEARGLRSDEQRQYAGNLMKFIYTHYARLLAALPVLSPLT